MRQVSAHLGRLGTWGQSALLCAFSLSLSSPSAGWAGLITVPHKRGVVRIQERMWGARRCSHLPQLRVLRGSREAGAWAGGALCKAPLGPHLNSYICFFLPRAGRQRPGAAEEDLLAAFGWPRPSPHPGAPRQAPSVAWTDHMERPGPPGQACSRPAWTASEEAQEGDSSVSSGRLSGSSGGHKSCAPAHRPWKERPPLVLASPQQHGESNPRLEQLREKIRAQACWQASCASLGTSMPSSASHLLRASPPAPRRKVRKLKKAPPAPACPGQEQLPGEGGRAVLGAWVYPLRAMCLRPREGLLACEPSGETASRGGLKLGCWQQSRVGAWEGGHTE